MKRMCVTATIMMLFLGVPFLFASDKRDNLKISGMELLRKGTIHKFSQTDLNDFRLNISCFTDTGEVDIIFILDTTGSMQTEISQAIANINDFAANMAASGLDYALGIVTYGDGFNFPCGYDLTSNLATFYGCVPPGSYGGWDTQEEALDAIMAAIDNIHWRLGSLRVIILITDAEFCEQHEGPGSECTSDWEATEVQSHLIESGVIVFTVTPRSILEDPWNGIPVYHYDWYVQFAETTGGAWFELGSDFGTIFDDINSMIGTFQVIQVHIWNDTPSEIDTVSALISVGSCIEILLGDNLQRRLDVPAGDTVTFFWRVNYTAGCTGPNACFSIAIWGGGYDIIGNGCMYIENCWCSPTVAENIWPQPGVWSACNPQQIIMRIYDDDIGVDANSIVLRVNGTNYTYPAGGAMNFHNDTLVFTPSGLLSGDTVLYEIVQANDIGGCTLSTHPESWFVVDFDPPVFFNEIPPNNSLIGGTPPEISVSIADSLAGLDTTTLSLRIGETTFTIGSGLTYSGGRLIFTPSGYFEWAEGDTICVVATAGDLVITAYCGPNVSEFQWCFLIDFLHLWFTDTILNPGDDIVYPLNCDPTGNLGIRNFELWLAFNPAVLTMNNVITTGTASAGFTINWERVGNLIHITGTSATAMPDNNVFLYIELHVNDDAPGASFTPIYVDSALIQYGHVGYVAQGAMILVNWQQQQWVGELFLTGELEGGEKLETRRLAIGCTETGTDGYDSGQDGIWFVGSPDRTIAYLPINDPENMWISRLWRDIRNAYELPVVWTIITEVNPGVMTWNPNHFPDGIFTLNGYIDMKRETLYYYSANETLYIRYEQPRPATSYLRVLPGWNLLSLPTEIRVPNWSEFVPSIIAGPYEFDGETQGFFQSSSIRRGYGFFVYAERADSIPIGGVPIDTAVVRLYKGWNLVGAVSETCWFEANPPGAVGIIYGYDNPTGTFTMPTELVPGHGYWVFTMSNDAFMILKP